MKLKLKIPIIFTVLVLLLAILLAAFIKNYVIGTVLTEVIENRKSYEKEDRMIVKEMENHVNDKKYIKAFLEKTARKERISITLFDSQLNTLYTSSWGNSKLGFGDMWYQIPSNNEVKMLLKIKRPLYAEDIALRTVFVKIFWFLLVFLLVAGSLLTIFFHHFITRPIKKLNTRLSNIKNSFFDKKLTTRRKDEIGELYQHVSEMEDRLRKSSEEQIEMIAAITHDIKTPLTSINGFIELLQTKKSLSEIDRKEYLDLIEKKAFHVTNLMNEFSSYTKNEVLLPTISFDVLNIKWLFESIAVEYEAELSGLDFTLTWEHNFHKDIKVMINEAMIRRVFANLISNAVRYSNIDDLKVKMIGYQKGDKVIIRVEDNGIGVPEQDLPKIFQKFFTVDKSRQIKEGGTGLGLASCKSIIERHGGKIEAYPSLEGGLGICFSLPIVKA